PLSPRITALSEPWPFPVKAREPRSATSTEATFSTSPESASPLAKAPAAFIGPTVWDDDGPMPILNSSKTLIIVMPAATACQRPYTEPWLGERVKSVADRL